MKALWIRVDANKLQSEAICEMADDLEVPAVYVLGHVVALGGEIAHRIDDGVIVDVKDSTLERWADWRGKRGAFAVAVRAHMQNGDGQFDEWSESMGKLVERRVKERARKRGPNSGERAQQDGVDSPDEHDTPPDIPRKTPPIPRNVDGNDAGFRGVSAENDSNSAPLRARTRTGRNGTERNGTVSTSIDLNGGAGSSAPATAASAPPARAIDPSELPREAIEFVVRHYPRGTDPKRRRDVVNQLLATLGDGARYKSGLVRALNVGRLAAKCRDVLREGVRDPNAAIVVLLAKLADSTDYTDEQRQKDHVERETEQRATLHDTLAAEQWLVERADVATSIDEQLEREGFPAVQLSDADDPREASFVETCRRFVRTALVLTHWRAAGAPEAAHAGSGP